MRAKGSPTKTDAHRPTENRYGCGDNRGLHQEEELNQMKTLGGCPYLTVLRRFHLESPKIN